MHNYNINTLLNLKILLLKFFNFNIYTMTELTNNDYNAILKYYGIPLSNKNKKKNKKIAEHLLATKLCRCIKKVKKTTSLPDKSVIAVCNKSIFRKRNIKYNKFSCKNDYKLIKNKRTRRKLSKTGKLKFNKTRKSR
tara:strand:+ start:84 stop:494 length:411 start_codon:yes stop_codon:yes gene_type:complete